MRIMTTILAHSSHFKLGGLSNTILVLAGIQTQNISLLKLHKEGCCFQESMTYEIQSRKSSSRSINLRPYQMPEHNHNSKRRNVVTSEMWTLTFLIGHHNTLLDDPAFLW